MTENHPETINPPMPADTSDEDCVRQVVDVLRKESAAIASAADRIDQSIARAIQLLFDCHGRVIVTGMGKMGCIARKATATFCSTGTPAVFLHPGEAVHGDLGIVTENDVLIVLSNSGETREVLGLLPHLARLGVSVIGLTGNLNSSLATRCTVVIDTGVEFEADPIAVAPTSSTTVALAMCDALAIALMNRRGFTKEQFAIFHPGGNLGSKLLVKVTDVMHVGEKIPHAL
jgi:arabinose-5-phosphate isomerase